MVNKLASIEEVVSVKEIDGADTIEVVSVLGWNCVVKKDLGLKKGDRVVYIAIDSVVPTCDPNFEFMKERKGRVRTVRLKGCWSQGLVVPLSNLPVHARGLPTGTDVSADLGVVHYEDTRVMSIRGDAKGARPGWVHKTDETNLQQVPGILGRTSGLPLCVTEKVDGTSATFGLDPDGEFFVCSRNLMFSEDSHVLYSAIARKFDVKRRLARVGGAGTYVQGEIFGVGVTKNSYGGHSPDFRAFDVFSDGKFLDWGDAASFVGEMGLLHVPELDLPDSPPSTVDEWLDFADGESTFVGPREGVVVRTKSEKHDPEAGRTSFKVLSRKYDADFREKKKKHKKGGER